MRYWIGRALPGMTKYNSAGSVAGTAGRVRYDAGDFEIPVDIDSIISNSEQLHKLLENINGVNSDISSIEKLIDLLDRSLTNLELITLATILSTDDDEILELENFVYEDSPDNLELSKIELWDILMSEIIELNFFDSALKTAILLADVDMPPEIAEIIVEKWKEEIYLYLYSL